MIDTADARESIKRRESRSILKLKESYASVFSKASPDAAHVIQHICKAGFISRSTFVPGDPYQTAVNEGSRRLALVILKFANEDPNKLIEQILQQ